MTAPDWLAKAQAAAGAAPQARTEMVQGRVLLIDGDALAYTCGGGDSPGQARINLKNHVAQAERAASAERAVVLLTARDSNKGHRYAIARIKPYQGHRSSGRRPGQWEFLRGLLESNNVGTPVESTSIAEADDLFSDYSWRLGPSNVVIHTQDKDMRMVGGWHLSWNDMRMFYLAPDTWAATFNDKLYGRKWFWMQMLMGDAADNVPGLPKMTKPDGKQALCGEATAAKLLDDCVTEKDARAVVSGQYASYYGDKWAVNMLEQGVLLWMRRNATQWVDVCNPGGPLHGLPYSAAEELATRIPIYET